ncbi:DsrE family protein [Teredinibacter waterburyi]|jgi:Uncharacterized conserved protein involved in intracellular sulfur reduction|uniref:DsrE family protein n=1 Tax=Teredinibacter waterburyi TaxID=1500538 RepID=UPI00165FF93B|nr:DsrE family protein [Teredinibacter waterburyi]
MNIFVLINAAPGSATATQALRVSHALLAAGHDIGQIFFYEDGVLHAQPNLKEAHPWRSFFEQYATEAICCSKAANKYELTEHFSAGPYHLGGMAQMIAQQAQADRVLTFAVRNTNQQDDAV